MQQGKLGLRVGINALFWPQERTGSGQYTRQLWEALNSRGENEYNLLGYETLSGSITGVPGPLIKSLPIPAVVRAGGENLIKLWWEQKGLPGLVSAEARKGRPYNVIHYPYFSAPLARFPSPTGLIVTIHDLIPLALPEYSPGSKLRAYFKLVSLAARRADLIMADSEYSKADIIRFLKVPSRKVQVVYLAADSRYFPGKLNPEARQALLRRYGLEGNEQIIFYLGGFDRRKNVITLLEAFARALPELKELEKTGGGGQWKLVLGGKAHNTNLEMYPDLQEPASRLFGSDEGRSRVHFTGPITEEDKPLFYRTAELYAFPSYYEGFGLDPLEAIASGAPVICSNATCLPEIVGEAARLIPPLDQKGWVEAIIDLARNPGKRAEMAAAGPVQAAKFSWARTANRTLELYNVVECVHTRGVAQG